MMNKHWKNFDVSIRSAMRPRTILFGTGLIFLLVMSVYGAADKPENSPSPSGTSQAVRVETAVATRGNVPITIDGLGTVQAFYTVTISPRVDGELLKLGFVEGQTVKSGDLLAQIDSKPYRAALDQAIATKAKDAAQLANARLDLERYITLAPEEFTSKQTLETQRSLVAQLEAQLPLIRQELTAPEPSSTTRRFDRRLTDAQASAWSIRATSCMRHRHGYRSRHSGTTHFGNIYAAGRCLAGHSQGDGVWPGDSHRTFPRRQNPLGKRRHRADRQSD